MGLVMKSSPPLRVELIWSWRLSRAVKKRMGIRAPFFSRARIFWQAVSPSITGMSISMSTRSGFSLLKSSTASLPLAADKVRKFRRESWVERISRMEESSSTIRIFFWFMGMPPLGVKGPYGGLSGRAYHGDGQFLRAVGRRDQGQARAVAPQFRHPGIGETKPVPILAMELAAGENSERSGQASEGGDVLEQIKTGQTPLVVVTCRHGGAEIKHAVARPPYAIRGLTVGCVGFDVLAVGKNHAHQFRVGQA